MAEAQLLTAKPVIFVANVDEDEVGDEPTTGPAIPIAQRAEEEGADFVVVSAKLEAELSELDPAEAEEFLHGLGPVSYTHLDVYKRQP